MRHTLFFAAGFLVTAFLTLPFSQPVWEWVPLLELAEFPWRWLGPAILCAALLAGALLHMLEKLSPKAGNWALGVGLLFTLAANLFYLFPAQFIPWGTPTPADAVAYEAQSGAIGTTSTGEFLPRWTDCYPSPDTLGPEYAAGRLPAKIEPASLPPGAIATTLAHTARETRMALSSPSPFVATFRALYWPGWQVVIAGDGDQVPEVQITQPEGLIQAHLPAGEYQVSLRLSATPVRRAATVISVLSLAALGILALFRRGRKSANQRPSFLATRRSLLTTPYSLLPRQQALIIGAALVAGLLVTRPMAGWFRVQSPPDTVYGAQQVRQADFGDQMRLLAYDLPGCAWWLPGSPCSRPVQGPVVASDLPSIQVEAGGSLPVVLYWQALAPLATDYRVFAHLDAGDGKTYASADERHPENIPTSNWPPSLYVRNPLIVDLPPELPPVRYTLTAGLYDPESGERLPVTAGGTGDVLPLAHVWLTPARPMDEEDVPNRLDARLGERVTLLGYDLAATTPTTLTLYWRAETCQEGPGALPPYTVFIHALDASDTLVAQFDAPPLDGLYPSDAWLPGQIVADPHIFALPESAQTLAVGLYDPVTGQRLPALDAGGTRLADDAVVIAVDRPSK